MIRMNHSVILAALIVLLGIPLVAWPDAKSDTIDWTHARELYKRDQRGEKLSAEDQAYLDKAKAARQGQQTGASKDAAADGIDWERAKNLYQRDQKGEKLSPEDQAYLDKAKAIRQGGPARQNPDNKSPVGGKTWLDLVPLSDLTGGEKYKDQDGGLYGNGSNTPPAAQMKLAEAAAAQIRPLDEMGKAAEGGKIVLMSIGMSNTTNEFSRFKQIADADARKANNVVIVDGAQGGKDAAAWLKDGPWKTADERLRSAGVSPNQVQTLWIKQAMMGPARLGEFPKHAEVLKSDIEEILSRAKKEYPNVKLAYLSSRIYAGYANTQLNPEPYAYESAFSVRWVIADQVAKDSRINADPAQGEIKAPVALWGPYLWSNGIKGRKIDGLIYDRADLSGDGTHPSTSGRQKVAECLLNFFTTDSTAAAWFMKK